MAEYSIGTQYYSPQELSLNGVDLKATANTNYDSPVINFEKKRSLLISVRVVNTGTDAGAPTFDLYFMPESDDGSFIGDSPDPTTLEIKKAIDNSHDSSTIRGWFGLTVGSPVSSVGDAAFATPATDWDYMPMPRLGKLRVSVEVASAHTTSLCYVSLLVRE